MDELTEFGHHSVTALGGAGIAGAFMKLLLGRQAKQLDETLSNLAKSIEELRKETQAMRETHVAFAKDLGSLTKSYDHLEERQNEMSKAWREKHDEQERRWQERFDRFVLEHNSRRRSAR